jgi:acyl carrier protein
VSRAEISAELVALARRELKRQAAPELETLDSLERLQLAVAIEDHFRICLDERDEQAISNLSDLVDVIARKLDDAA